MIEQVIVDALIELPEGSRIKYEIDQVRGILRVDRILPSPVVYPANYGYIPETLAEDGDALDILVLGPDRFLPTCVVPARVIGALDMTDDKGRDVKILSVCAVDPYQQHIQSLSDVASHTLRAISHFFSVYKELEGLKVEVKGWMEKEEACETIAQAREAYRSR
jgi:Inorganic pyrophosphatase